MTAEPAASTPDWEAFHRDLRKPGYVRGYEITSKLGSGMSGHVYRARKASIGKDYAIKFLQIGDAAVQRAVQSELEQLRHFAQVDHPNLVAIEDRGVVDGIPYVVMAFAGTETLHGRMPAGAPPAPAAKAQLLRWFVQAARGVQALHDHGLVHFDVKPGNVFLKGDVARLGDYGLSKLVDGSRASLSMARGTPLYMPPEMLERRGDRRSDIYSLGCMLYEMLCGRPPFTGDDAWQILKQHESAVPAMPAHLSPRERDVLLRCLAKDPAARFPDISALLAALGEPGPAPAPTARVETVALPTIPSPPPAPAGPSAMRRLGRLARAVATRLEPIRGGLGLVGLLVLAALFAALWSQCFGPRGGR